MRSNLLVVLAALATGASACVSRASQLDTRDPANVSSDDERSLPADITATPLSSRELAAFRRSSPLMQLGSATDGIDAQITAASRWDSYLAGDTTVLFDAERRGLVLFARAGCVTCHDGLSVGGAEYRRLGAEIPIRALADSGRYNATKDPADLFVFKVASLRNVQLTPPYLHDGSVKKLGEAVRLMGRHQLGVDLTEDQVRDIRAYLASLNGRMPVTATEAR